MEIKVGDTVITTCGRELTVCKIKSILGFYECSDGFVHDEEDLKPKPPKD